jgi:hypothetical protein
MKITNLKLIEKNGTSVIFEVSYKSFFGEKKRLAHCDLRYRIFHWMDNSRLIGISTESIDAWLSTGLEELKIY